MLQTANSNTQEHTALSKAAHNLAVVCCMCCVMPAAVVSVAVLYVAVSSCVQFVLPPSPSLSQGHSGSSCGQPKACLGSHPALPKACLGSHPAQPKPIFLWRGLPSTKMAEPSRMVPCALCEKEVELKAAVCMNLNKRADGKKGFYRCVMCNRLSSRIYRAQGKVDWVSKEARKEFFLQHSTLTGKDLRKELVNTTTQVEKETSKVDADEDVEWLDEVDLKAKYENKPDQLKAILSTAETRTHPTRKVTLYADITFKTKSSKSHEFQAEAKRQCTSLEVIKGPKKIKKEEGDDGGAAAAPTQNKPLSNPQRARLTKLEQKMGQIWEQWTSLKDNTDDVALKPFLPQPLLAAATKAMAEVDACIAEVPVVLSEAWVGDFKAVHARVSAAVDAGLASNGRVASLITMATEMLNQSS